MPAALIIQLIITLGPQAINLITTLIQRFETNGAVSSTEWTALTAQLNISSTDLMNKQLAAAAVDPNSPLGKSLLNLAK